MTKCNKDDCPNWGMIVVDANPIRYLLCATIELERKNIGQGGWSPQLPKVQASLSSNLELIKHCSSDNQIVIPEIMWSEELTVGKLRESAHPLYRNTSVYTKAEVRTLRDVIKNSLNVYTGIQQSDISQLQAFFRTNGNEYLADHDTTLFVTALKLGQGTIPVRIVSQDPDVQNPWFVLARQGSIELSGVQYKTDALVVRSYADFVTCFHKCCACSSDKYKEFCHAWLFPITGRQMQKSNQRGQIKLIRQVHDTIRIVEDSIEEKTKSAV